MATKTKLVPVVSSNIAFVGYDPKEKLLEVQFSNGSLYRYTDVPQAVYDGMLKSPSVGSYFAAYVRNHYDAVRVTE